MKVYVNCFKSYTGYSCSLYASLSEALRKEGTANLYTIDLKENEYICHTSIYQYWHSAKEGELVYGEDRGKDNTYTFIFKEGENPLYFGIEEWEKRTEDFVKRLLKFDEKEKMKQNIEKQIEELQKQLHDLEDN